jgi:cytochrome P450
MRQCVGKAFAYTEIKMLTLAMLERYDVGGCQPCISSRALLICPRRTRHAVSAPR